MKKIPLIFICFFIIIIALPSIAFGRTEPPFKLVNPGNNSQQYSLGIAGIKKLVHGYFADTYTVSISASPAEGGSLSGSGTYNYGYNVTVNATPRPGYTFANWTENGTLISNSSTYSFIINSNRNLVANFTPFTYLVSATANPSEGGTLSGSGTYTYGSNVTLNATPRAGYSFLYWTENGVQISENSFYNFTVKANRTFVANFAPIIYNGIISSSAAPTLGGTVSGGGTFAFGTVVTLAATPNTGYNFSNWTENGTIVSTTPAYSFTVSGNRSLTANFTIRTNIVTVTTSQAGGGTASGGGTYNYGSVVNLNATPNPGYSFVSWTENGIQVSTSSTYSFTINANRSLIARFTPSTLYTILAYATPSAAGEVNGGGIYVYGSLVTLNTIPGKGYSFINWTENGIQVSTSTSYSFTINSDRTIIANYTPLSYTILASALPEAGGSVSGAGTYDFGSVASLTATAKAGYTFKNWTEGGTIVSTNSTYSFTIEGSRTITANYAVNKHTIAVATAPADGGTVSGGGIFNYGSPVTLKAIPAFGYSFVNWTENGTQVSTSSTYSFSITTNRTIIANFTLNPGTYSISALAIPSAGGTISGGKAYINGSLATLTATPNTGYDFTNWTEGGIIVSSNPSYSFTVTGNRTLNANFKITTNSLIVNVLPAQGGTVIGSGLYDYGSTVTLIATPGTGYSFTNWTENGAVISTNSNYSFTLNRNRTLVANFTLNPGTYSILVSAMPTAGGTVSGGKTYISGSVATLIASPDAGYSFTTWNENGTVVSTNSVYSFTVTGSRTLIANFTVIINTVLVAAKPTEGGAVSGNGTYTYGSIVTLTAIPATGYSFANWTENGIQLSSNSTYSFTAISNRTLVANFTRNKYTILATVVPSTGGSVNGDVIYDFGSVATLKAATNTGYNFTGWTEEGTLVSSDSIYSFVVTQSRNLLANFAIKTQTISAAASPVKGGTVSGGGEYIYGNVLTLYTIPMNGYSFVNWTENGSEVSKSSTYSFTINEDRSLVANYILDTYNISALTSPSAGGTVSGGKTYEYGSLAILAATTSTGYSFTNWTEDGTVLSTDSIFSFIVERSRTITANYAVSYHTISAVASPSESGFVSGGGTFKYGSNIILNATPHIGYNFINWTENGTQVSTSSVFSISVDTDRTLVANFSHNSSNNGIILASVSPAAGGSVSGSNSYEIGSFATVTAIANTGYSFSNWTEGGAVVSTDSIYSFTVERSRTLLANFAINTHIISVTASSADGGFLTGGGTYNYGSVAFLNATPSIGYRFVNWTEDDTSLSTNSAYSFTVESNRTLVANFTLLVGLQENISQEIRMYPNPAHTNLYFEYAFPEKAEIKIYTNSGQLVLTSFEKTINISDMLVGFYFVKVKEQAFKLVKE